MPKNKKSKKESSDSASESGTDSGSDSSERDPPPKKQKKAAPAKPSKPAKASKNDDNEVSWNLSADKMVKVREFRGKVYVDIRQYYNGPSGDLLPTKKGISLPAESYQKLKSLISEIDEELKKF